MKERPKAIRQTIKNKVKVTVLIWSKLRYFLQIFKRGLFAVAIAAERH